MQTHAYHASAQLLADDEACEKPATCSQPWECMTNNFLQSSQEEKQSQSRTQKHCSPAHSSCPSERHKLTKHARTYTHPSAQKHARGCLQQQIPWPGTHIQSSHPHGCIPTHAPSNNPMLLANLFSTQQNNASGSALNVTAHGTAQRHMNNCVNSNNPCCDAEGCKQACVHAHGLSTGAAQAPHRPHTDNARVLLRTTTHLGAALQLQLRCKAVPADAAPPQHCPDHMHTAPLHNRRHYTSLQTAPCTHSSTTPSYPPPSPRTHCLAIHIIPCHTQPNRQPPLASAGPETRSLAPGALCWRVQVVIWIGLAQNHARCCAAIHSIATASAAAAAGGGGAAPVIAEG